MWSRLFITCRSQARVAVFCGFLTAPWLSGCSGKQAQPWEKVYPAKGVVTYKGNPVPDAEIALFSEDDSFPRDLRPKARSTEDGSFVLWTHKTGDGAPAGTYKATVVHQVVDTSGGIMGVKPNDLPKKYSHRETTDLVVEINEGENEIETLDLN